MRSVERLPEPDLGFAGLSLRSLAILQEVRHWGCIRATARLGQMDKADFEAAYLSEMEMIWDLNEDLLVRLRHIRSAAAERSFWLDFQAARAFSIRSDAALFKDMVLRP